MTKGVLLLVALGFTSVLVSACAAESIGVVCVDDTGCGDGLVCAFGQCADPNLGALGLIQMQVEPSPDTNVPVQALLDVDPATGARLDLQLRPGVTLVGDVTRDGVGVAAQIVGRPDRSIAGRALAATGASDDGGGFTLVGVEEQRYAIAILPDDPAIPPFYDDVGVRAEPGNNGVREIPPYELPVAVVVVTGRIVAGDGASVQGIPALDVRLRHADAPRAGRRASSTARTGADGSFSLSLEPADNLVLEVRPTTDNEYAPALDVVDIDVDADFGLGDISLGVVLSPVRFSALVLDEAGVPVVGASVSLDGLVGLGRFKARATTDAGGTAAVDVPPGTYDVAVLGPQTLATGLQTVSDVVVPLDSARLTVQLAPRVPCAGTVRDPLVGAVPAAGLAFIRVGGVAGDVEPALADTFVGAAAVTGPDGSFDVPLPPGRYRMNVSPPLSSSAPPLSTLITVDEDGFDADVALPARAILAGTVLFEDQAVPNAYVRVFGDATTESGTALQLGEGQAGPDGRFEIVVAAEAPTE